MPASDLPCLAAAWTRHEAEIRRWLAARGPDPADADDLLQETFLRALRQDRRFCAIANPRAWLFEVARHLLIDRHRKSGDTADLTDDLPAPPPEEPPAVDGLAACLPRVLGELSDDDREAIVRCDLEGMTQADFAAAQGITLAAAKSRVRRARARLKQRLSTACRVRLDDDGKVCGFTPRP